MSKVYRKVHELISMTWLVIDSIFKALQQIPSKQLSLRESEMQGNGNGIIQHRKFGAPFCLDIQACCRIYNFSTSLAVYTIRQKTAVAHIITSGSLDLSLTLRRAGIPLSVNYRLAWCFQVWSRTDLLGNYLSVVNETNKNSTGHPGTLQFCSKFIKWDASKMYSSQSRMAFKWCWAGFFCWVQKEAWCDMSRSLTTVGLIIHLSYYS